MANILITGGSGMLGRAISKVFLEKGHEVRWLSRHSGKENQIHVFKWDIEKSYMDEKAFENLHCIIHLAGAGIVNKSWSDSYKKEIIDSRVKSSDLLFKYYTKLKPDLKCFIGASAIGYYGVDSKGAAFIEADLEGSDFMSEVCKNWEKSYDSFVSEGLRTVIFRIGIVLSNQGGAYAKLKSLFQLGLGASIGSGKQAFPWIHIQDLSQLFYQAFENAKVNGTYNAVAEGSTTNAEFSTALAKSLHRYLLLPGIPEFFIKLIMGERAMTITRGVPINNSKLKLLPYNFQFNTIESALNNLANKN